MNIKSYILDAIQPIEDGKTVRVDCPECGGSKTFTITVEGDSVLYNCYRASCDRSRSSGRVFLRLSVEERVRFLKKRKDRDKELRAFIKPAYWLDGIGNDACLRYMQDNHMMQAYTDKLFRPMYDAAERRFVFPIKNSYGEVIGAVGRTLIGANPKVLNYNRAYTQPFVCGKDRSICILVEDCASAVAATRHPAMAGMALLGTEVRDDFVPHLSPYKTVFIGLDPDAYKKSLKIKKHLTTYIKDVRVLRLPDDIKDMADEDYNIFINNSHIEMPAEVEPARDG